MKILIINVNWLGDVLFSTPLIRCLRHKYPLAFIASLLPQRCFPVLENNPYLDELIPINEKRERKRGFDFSALRQLRKYKFDISLHLHRSFSRRYLAFLAGIKERIGYPIKMKGILLTKRVKLPPPYTHRALYYFRIGEVLNIKYDGRGCDFYLRQEDLDWAKNLLKETALKESEYIVFNPGGNWLPKRWPPLYWAKLADIITKNYEKKIVIVGSKDDLDLAWKINSHMSSPGYIFAGRTNLKQLGAILKLASVVISADSAPLHIAQALGVRVIGLYGPTSPQITGPFGQNNAIVIKKWDKCEIPCYLRECKLNYKCMSAITPEIVYEEGIKKIFSQT